VLTSAFYISGIPAQRPVACYLFTVIGAIGCFERELMLEAAGGDCQSEAQGTFKGRKPTARARAAGIATLRADGVRPVDALPMDSEMGEQAYIGFRRGSDLIGGIGRGSCRTQSPAVVLALARGHSTA
jgi:hypothetical protein